MYLLTGTPMTNRPRDLFNLLKAVRHPLATSFYSYAKRYCAAFDNGYGLDSRGASNVEELAQVVAGVMLRRTKDEALDLPPKTRTWQPVEIDSAEVRRAEATALAFFADNPQRDGPAWATFLGKLNQARHALALAKVEATLEAVRERLEAGEKVVVFSSYSGVIERLKAELGDPARVITGATPAAQRQAAADAFQKDPDVRVLLGNLVAAGVGLTLTAGTHVVFNDLDWVPANHWQAEDRIYRIGQTRPAFVTYLVAEGTLDDYVAALLEQKARLVGVLEEEAADRATLVEAVVEAAVSGERPDWGRLGVEQAERVAAATDGGSMGLLGDVLDLLARAGRGLGAISAEQVIEVPSRSRPGEVNIVRIVAGVATCSCKGFSYRGDCSHAREAARSGGGVSPVWHYGHSMATIKMTFSLDEATAARLEESAASLRKPKSEVVREAIRDYAERVGRLTEAERRRLLGVFDELVPAIPARPVDEVDAELSELRQARRQGGRGRAPA